MLLLMLFCSRTAFTQVSQEAQNLTPEQIKIVSDNSWMKKATKFTDKTLRIGDKVPDAILEKVFNYPGGTAKLSDFNGKYIILDFWSRMCKSCIGAFPKMEKIQEEFKKDLQILAVCTYSTWEPLNLLEPGFPKGSSSEYIRNTKLPLVFNSEELRDWFPHFGEPYLVVINREGYIMAMLDGMDSATMRAIIEGKQTDFPVSFSFTTLLDTLVDYDENFSILKEGNHRQVERILYLKRPDQNPDQYFVLAKLGRPSGAASLSVYDTISGSRQQVGERFYSPGLRYLYKYAYGSFMSDQQMVVESATPDRYFSPWGTVSTEEFNTWHIKNKYVFEAGPTQDSTQSWLRQALVACFPEIGVIRERRTVKCLVLKRSSSKDKLGTKFAGQSSSVDNSAVSFKLRNCRFETFIGLLKSYNLDFNKSTAMPLLDETGYKGNIDMNLYDLKDLAGLKKQLIKYDLVMEEAERELEVLVLNDGTLKNSR